MRNSEVHKELIAEGYISKKQQEVLDALTVDDTQTAREIASITGIAVHNVAGRLSELIRMGKAKECDKAVCQVTKRNVATYRAATVEEIEEFVPFATSQVSMQNGVSYNRKNKHWVVYIDGALQNKQFHSAVEASTWLQFRLTGKHQYVLEGNTSDGVKAIIDGTDHGVNENFTAAVEILKSASKSLF